MTHGWVYKVIGADEAVLREAVLEVVAEEDDAVEVSNRSSGDSYVSLDVRMIVVSDEHGVGIYEELRSSAHVRIVL